MPVQPCLRKGELSPKTPVLGTLSVGFSMVSLVRPPSTVRPQNNARRHHTTISSRDALLKNHHMTILSRDSLWQHNPGRKAHCARPSSDDRHIPSPGEDKKNRQQLDRIWGLDVDGAQETTCGEAGGRKGIRSQQEVRERLKLIPGSPQRPFLNTERGI